MSVWDASEGANADRFRASFHVVAPAFNCILPFLEAADVVITDYDSSAAFEALYEGVQVCLAGCELSVFVGEWR